MAIDPSAAASSSPRSGCRRALVVAALAWLVQSGVAGADCDFLPTRAKPEWAGAGTPPTSSQVLYGVGVALAKKGTPDEVIRQARQAAIADLAESITVDVRAKVTQVASRMDSGRKITKKIDFTAVAETSSELTLKSVEPDDQWLDRSACVLWSRVRIKKELAELAVWQAYYRRVQLQVDELLTRALDNSVEANARLAAADEARGLVEGFDFSLIKDGAPKQLLLSRIDKAASAAKGGLSSKAQTEVTVRRALDLSEQARTSVNAYDKAVASNEAVRLLRAALRDNPSGVPGVASGVDLWARVAEAELDRGNQCEARRALQTSLEPTVSGSAAERERAGQRLTPLRCGPEEQRKALWSAMFAGRRVGLVCFREVAGVEGGGPWRKACDVLSNSLAALGARILQSSEQKLGFQDLGLANATPRKLEFGPQEPEVIVAIGAEGKLVDRANAESATGREYQYSGPHGHRRPAEGGRPLLGRVRCHHGLESDLRPDDARRAGGESRQALGRPLHGLSEPAGA
jgi:hypothetical protein